MLVLSRRSGEAVVISGNVTVRVLRVEGDRIRLGIEAPQEVPVHREEIHLEIEKKKQSTVAA